MNRLRRITRWCIAIVVLAFLSSIGSCYTVSLGVLYEMDCKGDFSLSATRSMCRIPMYGEIAWVVSIATIIIAITVQTIAARRHRQQ